MPANRAPAAREADRVPGAPQHRSVQQQTVAGQRDQQDRQLRRNDTPQVALPELQKRRRKAGEVRRGLRDAFGDAAKHRHRSQRDNQGRQSQPRNQDGVQPAAEHPDDQRRRRSGPERQSPVVKRGAERHRREPDHRPARQIDAAADHHRRQRHRQQSELDTQPQDLDRVGDRGEPRRDGGEHRDLGEEGGEHDPLAVREPALPSHRQATGRRLRGQPGGERDACPCDRSRSRSR